MLQFAGPYKKRFYASIFLAILLAVLTPVRPYLIQVTVDKYISGKLAQAVINITIVQILFLLIETGLRFYFSYITSWLGQAVVKDMRIKVYDKVLHLNLRQFDKTPIGPKHITQYANNGKKICDDWYEAICKNIIDAFYIVHCSGG